MKLEIVGLRKLTHINIDEYILDGVDEIVSGGAVGVDAPAGSTPIARG